VLVLRHYYSLSNTKVSIFLTIPCGVIITLALKLQGGKWAETIPSFHLPSLFPFLLKAIHESSILSCAICAANPHFV
jgi:hypothetical protein